MYAWKKKKKNTFVRQEKQIEIIQNWFKRTRIFFQSKFSLHPMNICTFKLLLFFTQKSMNIGGLGGIVLNVYKLNRFLVYQVVHNVIWKIGPLLDNDTLFLISFELWKILTLKLNFLGPSISAGTLDFIAFRVFHYI